jgi:hypothetical protein
MNLKGTGPLLWCSLLTVLLAALLLVPLPSEHPLNAEGQTLTDFAEHVRQRGVQLHVVPGARQGGPNYQGLLTEDPDATWASLQSKVRAVECIHQWRGTVWVEYVHFELHAETALAAWGPYGGRIGDFILFGDERLLRQIQEACRSPRGRCVSTAGKPPPGDGRRARSTQVTGRSSSRRSGPTR